MGPDYPPEGLRRWFVLHLTAPGLPPVQERAGARIRPKAAFLILRGGAANNNGGTPSGRALVTASQLRGL
jgi:hypothetical protein